MADLSLEERLQPSLLDRLTDNEPSTAVESRSMRVLSMNRLKRSVLRDLAWLLNSASMEMTESLDEFPQVRKSVINFGVRNLAGRTASSIDLRELEKDIRRAILDFEPRILPQTLRVQLHMEDGQMSRNTMAFTIEGQLWAQPMPLSLFLSSELDLESGSTTVTEKSS